MYATTAAAAAAAAPLALLVAASPRWLFPAAAPSCVLRLALSGRAAPAGLAARLAPRWGDLGLALSTALLPHAGTRIRSPGTITAFTGRQAWFRSMSSSGSGAR